MGDERFSLKDHLFNADTVAIVADAVHSAHAAFDRDCFVDQVLDEHWEERALKQRMRHMAACLRELLPADYRESIAILRKASPDTAEAGFAAMSFSEFVEAFGVHDYETSVPALAEFTKVVSAEFAVRPFILEYPDRMMGQMLEWARDEDHRVRRLASEGSRPRLPWGMALQPFHIDPSPILPILETLNHDPSEEVRRSVANSLNDISRDHPDVVVATLTRWQDDSQEVTSITKHALRTLLKKGDQGALRLLGFDPHPAVRLAHFAADPRAVEIGAATTVRCEIVSESGEEQKVMIDGVVEFARPKGPSSKVFKWKTATLGPGERLAITRSVSLQPLSTRRIYPGSHSVAVQVNGSLLGRVEFDVIAPAPGGR